MSVRSLRAQTEQEELFRLEDEALKLMCVIVAEFESDPMSVQCFDLRIVERAKEVMRRMKQLDKKAMFPRGL